MMTRSAVYVGLLGVACALATPVITSAQSICATVPANASAGVSFGTVIAGQTYAYQASGCARRSSDNPNMADPDGNQYFGDCSAANLITNNVPAPAGTTCPGLLLFSLV